MKSIPFHLEPIHTSQRVVSGDVVIAEGVAIAPGVLLQADPGSRIVLGSGVCLGMGCVIHASSGEIRIDAGVNLGAGVLVTGKSKIGPGAIVGAGTTVFNQNICTGTIVPPSSLLVDQTLDPVQTHVPTPAASVAPEPAPPETNSPKHESEKVSLDGQGFFYSKGKKSAPVTDDPWVDEADAVVQDSNSSEFQTTTSAFNPELGIATPDFTPVDTEEAVVSTFVYPNDNCAPKHAWQVSAEASLHSPSSEATSVGSPPPNPDSDLSAAEMQSNGAAGTAPEAGGALAKPRQVYGQAYVNQMLGKMMGKH